MVDLDFLKRLHKDFLFDMIRPQAAFSKIGPHNGGLKTLALLEVILRGRGRK